jgi:2-(1,2-epoxy-1,2-dihydrophenyl)acetyl-CoA isomerase
MDNPDSAADLVVRESKGNVAIVRVNRPDRKNAITVEMLATIVQFLTEIEEDDSASALIFTGTGDTFLSGLDVGKVTTRVQEMDPKTWRDFRALNNRMFETIYRMKIPTVAAINGACVTNGFSLALASDVRIASTDAKFRIGFRRVALMPSPSICYLLPHLIGLGRAKLLALTDRVLSASEALDIGLVDELSAPEELKERAVALAKSMASAPPLMVAVTKEAMNQAYGLDFDLLRRQVDYMQFMLGRTEDHGEAMRAIAEKRQPRFVGK